MSSNNEEVNNEMEEENAPKSPSTKHDTIIKVSDSNTTTRKETIEGFAMESNNSNNNNDVVKQVQQTLQTLTVNTGSDTTDNTGIAAVVGSSTSSGISSVDQQRQRDVVTPPVPTPEMSIATINRLRGSSVASPAHSQVSVGSIGITPAALLPAKHYDLTPVTRNTSSDFYCETGTNKKNISTEESAITITPGSNNNNNNNEGYLHGEHLALPADLDSPGMPTLQPSQPFLLNSQDDDDDDDNNIAISSLTPPDIPAISFPSRKFYSFTTREQYEEALRNEGIDIDDDDDDLFHASDDSSADEQQHVRIPYAPSSKRLANFDIESLPDEELANIFLKSDIPMDRVPSLHRAYHVNTCNESTTSISYNETNEEEDSLIRFPDDHSLNSLHEEEAADDEDLQLAIRKHRKRKKEKQAVEWLAGLENNNSNIAEAASSKFLTQKGTYKPTIITTQQQQQQLSSLQQQRRLSTPNPIPMKRQISAPPTSSQQQH